MRTPRLKKADGEQFEKLAKEFLISEGAVAIPHGSFGTIYALQTIVGTLTLHICVSGYLTVFSKFNRREDIEAAREILDINPHSGKWNHHFGIMPVDKAIAEFKHQIARITPFLEEHA